MTKIFIRFILVVLVSNFLFLQNVYSFHTSEKVKSVPFRNDESDEKLFQQKQQQKYCSNKTSIIKQESSDKEKKDTDESVKSNKKLEIIGYHSEDPIKIGGKRLFIRSLNLDFEEHRYNIAFDKIQFLDILNYFCVQDSTKDRPEKFKGSYLEELYQEIAKDNGIVNKNNGEGNFKKKIEGDIYDVIAKEGILIKNPNIVYYIPDNYVSQYNKFISDQNEKIENQNRDLATKQGAEQWISENAQREIERIVSKLNEFNKEIEESKKLLNGAKLNWEDYKKNFNQLNKKTEKIFEGVDVSKKEIKEKKKELVELKIKVLDDQNFKNLEADFEKIENLKFDNYNNYNDLKKLEKKAQKAKKSNDANKFLGTKKITIGISKFKITLGQSKIGIIEEFENLEDRDLGERFKIDKDNIEKFENDIKKQLIDLNEYSSQLDSLSDLDEYLDDQIPLSYIIIGIVIFLAAIGFGLYVYFNNKRIKEIQEDADRTVSTLKTNLEGRLQNTAAELRSVKNARMNQSNTQNNVSSEQTAQVVPPKTPEQLIKDKFDELVSEYEEALDDFSKVATFKQKWNGLALTRKERQDGTKTILISSSRVFEKAEIWCVNFSDKYFAFPGSSVKSNMATYMNLDFEKASRDFKGVYSVSSGTNYKTEPAVLRKGGAGFVVERPGKIIFPS
jgi:hypothetical protein